MSETNNSSEDEEGQSVQFVPANVRKRSLIHNYFLFNQKSNTSVCKTCKAELTGKNSTNIINHLKKSIHLKNLYAKYLKEVSDKEEATASKKAKLSKEIKKPDPKQQTLLQVYSTLNKYHVLCQFIMCFLCIIDCLQEDLLSKEIKKKQFFYVKN